VDIQSQPSGSRAKLRLHLIDRKIGYSLLTIITGKS
jgi:hypothetical protein